MSRESARPTNRRESSAASKWLAFPAIAGGVFSVLFPVAITLGLTLLAAMEFALAFAGRRETWGRKARLNLQTHVGLLKIFARSFRSEESRESRISLQSEHAPDLFAMIVRLCGAEGLSPPTQICLEMSAQAWIRTDGTQISTLTVGYDLLAGLTVPQLETVLAHEIIHARRHRSRLTRWLRRRWEHASGLAKDLRRQSRSPRHRPANPGKRAAGAMSQLIAEATQGLGRFVSEQSRREELEADWGAAERCGIPATQAALWRVASLRRASARIPWRERLAQFQMHGLSQWLQREFRAAPILTWEEIAAETDNPYATHPTLHERLMALGGNSHGPFRDNEPAALTLLMSQDVIEEELLKTIEQAAATREENDSRTLRRWARKMRNARQMTFAQTAGLTILLLAMAAGAAAMAVGVSPATAAVIISVALLGIGIFWLGGFRAGFLFPVPDFGLLKLSWPTDSNPPQPIDNQFIRVGAARAMAALAECNYRRADVAAKRTIEREPDSIPALLACAVCAGWRGEAAEAMQYLSVVHHTIGFRGSSICWGAAWAFMLCGNWARGETLLSVALDEHPDDPTLLNLRALCQRRRGKIQSAIVNCRRACHPTARNLEHAKFLIDLLLDGGYVREAEERLAILEQFAALDDELALIMVRVKLRRGEAAAAREWTENLLRRTPPGYMLLRLAVYYELAHIPEEAAQFYQRALELAYYPDACLGLARLAANRNDATSARQHIFEALSLRRPLGEFATPPLELLGPILGQLAALEPRRKPCGGWIAHFGRETAPSALAGTAFLVYASDAERAQRHLQTVLTAMLGGSSAVIIPRPKWSVAPPEHQPIGPVRPQVRPHR